MKSTAQAGGLSRLLDLSARLLPTVHLRRQPAPEALKGVVCFVREHIIACMMGVALEALSVRLGMLKVGTEHTFSSGCS